MAITATHYELLKSLPIQRGSTLLEIGEANWYGDLDPHEAGLDRQENLFDIAKQFYQLKFSPSKMAAIDKHGVTAIDIDLNQPFDLGEQFDVVINHGTAEHIFNIGQVFRSMHDHCETDGWLIHDAPFMGWVDHGFYCLQPTLFYDLARANNYELAKVAIHEIKSRTIIELSSRDQVAVLAEAGQIPNNSMLFVAMRKRFDVPFAIPMQGYYARSLSNAGMKAWEVVR